MSKSPGQQWREQTPEEMERDLDIIKEMLVDILLAAKFQDKPQTFVRQKLKDALRTNKYDNWITNRLMSRAVKQALPASWLEKTFEDVLAAIQKGEAEDEAQRQPAEDLPVRKEVSRSADDADL